MKTFSYNQDPNTKWTRLQARYGPNTLLIYNFPPRYNCQQATEILEPFLKQFGNITFLRLIPQNQNRSRTKGYGYVSFDNKESYSVESKRYGKKEYMKLTNDSTYQTAVMPSVVNVEWYKSILKDNQTIHQFEVDGTNSISGKDNKIYFEEKPFPGIAPGIVRNGGFLIKGWDDFFKKEKLGDGFYHLHVVLGFDAKGNERERLLLDEE